MFRNTPRLGLNRYLTANLGTVVGRRDEREVAMAGGKGVSDDGHGGRQEE
jgi:hypothetical protein